jgi:beta-lactamase regulating signal transducer with metallopeptidase domain
MTDIILFAAKLTLLLAIGSVLALALRRHSAATRHFVWALTLGSALLFGVAAWFAPAVPVPIPEVARTFRPAVAVASAVTVSAPAHTLSADTSSVVSMPLLLAIIWLSGVGVAALWLCAGHLALRSVVRTAVPVQWQPLIDEARRAMGVAREVRVLMTARVSAPLTAGVLRPVIVMPADAEDWPEERRRAAVLHEMAHVARHDALVQWIANIALALYWFHPVVWIARTRLRNASELATDDRVVSVGMVAPDYAEHLLDVARAAKAQRFARLVAVGMACPSHLEQRLRALLDRARAHGGVSRGIAALAAVALALPLVPLAAARPAWQADESPAPHQRAAEKAQKAWRRGDAYILRAGHSDVSRSSTTVEELVRVRKRLDEEGPYLWFRTGSREYLIRDEEVLRQADLLWADIDALKPEQRAVSDEERELDHRIDAIEDRNVTASAGELEQLRERDRVVSRRERELDQREEALEKVAEAKLRDLVDDAIRSGVARRLR